jgi:hypothetical protein
MSKYGFNDDELQKLFADAGAAVKKVQKAPAPEDEAAREAPAPEKHNIQQEKAPTPARDAQASPFADSPPAATPRPDAPKPAPRPPAAAPGTARIIQIVGGLGEDANFQATTSENAAVTIPWQSIKALALGRVEDAQIIAWVFNRVVYYISDKKIAYKGLIPQLAPIATQNWRNLLAFVTQKTNLTNDAGIQAFQTPGGLIPKYHGLEALINHLQTL